MIAAGGWWKEQPSHPAAVVHTCVRVHTHIYMYVKLTDFLEEKHILWPFTKVAWKVKEEAPAPPKAEAKAKVLKVSKTVLKSILSHKKDPMSPTFQCPRHCSGKGNPNILGRAPPGGQA